MGFSMLQRPRQGVGVDVDVDVGVGGNLVIVGKGWQQPQHPSLPVAASPAGQMGFLSRQ